MATFLAVVLALLFVFGIVPIVLAVLLDFYRDAEELVEKIKHGRRL
jgi:hypothetical protein